MNKKQTLDDSLVQIRSSGRPALSSLRGLSGLDRRAVERLREAWPSLPLERRRWAASALAQLAEDNFEFEFSAAFAVLLGDEDAEVRRAAVEGLWESEDENIAEQMLAILSDDASPEVRAAAASALGHFAYLAEMEEVRPDIAKRTRQGLLAAIEGDNPLEVRRRAVEAVGFISADADIHHVIDRAYKSSDQEMRTSAVFAMGRNCDERWLPILLREMESDDPQMRFEAARASGEIEDKRAVPRLLRLLVDPDQEVKLAAIQSLGTIGGEQAIHALRYLTESEDPSVAEAAEEALAEAEFAESPLDVKIDDILRGDDPGHTH